MFKILMNNQANVTFQSKTPNTLKATQVSGRNTSQQYVHSIALLHKQKKIGFNLGGLKISSNVTKDVQEKQHNLQNESKLENQSDGFGSFGKIRNELTESAAAVEQNKQDDIPVETNPDIAKVMGFSGFGNGKKAKNFDMAQIMEEAKRKAQERNLAGNQQLEQQYEEMRESNPINK